MTTPSDTVASLQFLEAVGSEIVAYTPVPPPRQATQPLGSQRAQDSAGQRIRTTSVFDDYYEENPMLTADALPLFHCDILHEVWRPIAG